MCEQLTDYILIHRKIMYEWEHWYDSKTLHLFLYLLLKAQFKNTLDGGTDVKRGSLKTKLIKIREETGLTIGEIRSRLKMLTRTGEITIKTTNKYSIITVVNYNTYQFTTDKKQTNNKPTYYIK